MLSILFVVWTVMTHFVKVPQNKIKKQKGCCWTTSRLCAGPLSSRASRVLGPISRHRVADILPRMKIDWRASRPGLIVGFLRILCNGLCTAQRFHTEEHDHTCRVRCPNEPDSLTHYTECPRLYNIFFLSGDMLRYCLDHSSLLTKPSIWNRGTGLL